MAVDISLRITLPIYAVLAGLGLSDIWVKMAASKFRGRIAAGTAESSKDCDIQAYDGILIGLCLTWTFSRFC